YCLFTGLEIRRQLFRSRIREIRIRRMHLLDVVPGPAVAPVPVPSEIPYAIDGDTARDALLHPAEEPRSVRVAGRHSGHLEIEREPADLTRGVAGSTTVRYVDYSDDGERTWTGMEKLEIGRASWRERV